MLHVHMRMHVHGRCRYEVFGHIHVDTFYISRNGGGEPGTAPMILPPQPPAAPAPLFLKENLCQPPLLASGNTGAGSYGGCEQKCRRTPGCAYFGYEAVVGWCIVYAAPCVPCNSSTTTACGGSSVTKYNTYALGNSSHSNSSSHSNTTSMLPVSRGAIWVGLSLVASYPPKNGGVRRYSFDSVTKTPTDIEQWYFDVETSSKSGVIEWHKSWSADDLRLPPPPPPPPQPTPRSVGRLTDEQDSQQQQQQQEPRLQRLSPLDPSSLRKLALSWRSNHSAHAEFRARAFAKAPVSRYPNCTGDGVVADRCRMADACSVANAPLTE